MSVYERAVKLMMIVTALAVTLVFTNCSPNGPGGTPGSATNLVGAGATFPNPIYQKWVSDYQIAHSLI